MAAQIVDNALASNMVWQAAKWLQAYYVSHAMSNELHHFTSQEPAFTSHVAKRNMLFSQLSYFLDSKRCTVTLAVFHGLPNRTAVELHQLDKHLGNQLAL